MLVNINIFKHVSMMKTDGSGTTQCYRLGSLGRKVVHDMLDHLIGTKCALLLDRLLRNYPDGWQVYLAPEGHTPELISVLVRGMLRYLAKLY